MVQESPGSHDFGEIVVGLDALDKLLVLCMTRREEFCFMESVTNSARHFCRHSA